MTSQENARRTQELLDYFPCCSGWVPCTQILLRDYEIETATVTRKQISKNKMDSASDPGYPETRPKQSKNSGRLRIMVYGHEVLRFFYCALYCPAVSYNVPYCKSLNQFGADQFGADRFDAVFAKVGDCTTTSLQEPHHYQKISKDRSE